MPGIPRPALPVAPLRAGDPAALLGVARHGGWRGTALRGLAAVAFGLCALAWPEASLAVLLAVLTGYTAFAGGTTLVIAMQLARVGVRAWPLALYAVVALAAAAAIALWPAPATVLLVTVFAAWMVVAGSVELALTLRLRRVLPHVWPLGVVALTSLSFAWVLLAQPRWAAGVALRLVGLYALTTGAFLLGVAFRLRR